MFNAVRQYISITTAMHLGYMQGNNMYILCMYVCMYLFIYLYVLKSEKSPEDSFIFTPAAEADKSLLAVQSSSICIDCTGLV